MSLAARILAVLAALALAAGSGWGYGVRHVRAQWRAAEQGQALAASEAARESERMARRHMETIADETDRTLARVRADAAAARGAADGLRAAAAAAAGACRTASPAAPGPAASAAELVLADVLGRAAARAVELAEAADAAHAAGTACERAYGAVTR